MSRVKSISMQKQPEITAISALKLKGKNMYIGLKAVVRIEDLIAIDTKAITHIFCWSIFMALSIKDNIGSHSLSCFQA